jgi:hypothetical protein
VKLLWLLAAALMLSACQPPLATAVRGAAAELAPSAAELNALVLHADDARRAAFASADPRPLEPYFGGRSLFGLRLQVASLASRGQRREELVDARRVVHTGGSPGHPEAVLQIRARQRLVAGGSAGSWATTLRQWRAGVARQGEAWLVVDDGDLPPPAWWR